MIKRIFWGLVACLFCVCFASALAQAQEAATPKEVPPTDCESVKGLQAEDSLERVVAAQKILDGNGELINCLIRQLRSEIKNPDLRFRSSFEQLLWVLGELRVTAVVGDLVGIIDIRLVGSPPDGGFGGPASYYPAATALAEIGGPSLAKSILHPLNLTCKRRVAPSQHLGFGSGLLRNCCFCHRAKRIGECRGHTQKF